MRGNVKLHILSVNNLVSFKSVIRSFKYCLHGLKEESVKINILKNVKIRKDKILV